MSDPVAELAAELADLKRQIRELQTAPRATKTSVSGGYTRWLPANGAEYPKVYAGALGEDHVGFFVDQTDGDDGSLIAADLFMGITDATHVAGSGHERAPTFFVANPDHQLLAMAVIDGRVTAPLPACAWTPWTNNPIDSLGRRYTTSGTFTTLYYSVLSLHTDVVETGLNVIPSGGATSMDVRITIRPLDATLAFGSGVDQGSTEVTLVEEIGITGADTVVGPWTVPETLVTPNGSPIGLQCELLLKARVSGGTGNAVAAPYQPMFCRTGMPE